MTCKLYPIVKTNLKEKREYILIDNEVSEQIVNVINKYAFAEIDDTLIEIIESVLKNTYILDKKYENAINIVDIEDIEDTNEDFDEYGCDEYGCDKYGCDANGYHRYDGKSLDKRLAALEKLLFNK